MPCVLEGEYNMKLVAEQIKYLRERREELVSRKNAFTRYLSNSREKESMEGFGTPVYTDYAEHDEYGRYLQEIKQIDETLRNAEIVVDRNFDQIDVGTAFYAQFEGDEEKERITLVDKGITATSLYQFVSLDSDFGKAILGKIDGDKVEYTVSATGRKINVSIDSIDRMREQYTHFIREKSGPCRMSKVVKNELRELKENNPEEYARRHEVTSSQKELAREELAREKELTPVRKAFLNRILQSKTASLNTDGTIGFGSKVTVLLRDENGKVEEKTFEFINRAISTELDCHYVERISPLGAAIYGLRKDDVFCVQRNHMPSLQGVVVSVDNDYNLGTKRVIY